MLSLYTETFEDFLTRNEQSQAWQNVKAMFDKVPSFTFDDTTISVYDMLKLRYCLREIGAETESIFVHHVTDTIEENFVKYVAKIKLWKDNFESIADRKFVLNETSNNLSFLNPISSDSSRTNGKSTFVSDKEHAINQNISNAQLLEEAMSVRDIFNEFIDRFDNCFMEIY